MASKKGDLSITALYTSATWSWGRLPCAELLATAEARWIFHLTNFVLWVARLFRWDLPSLRHSLLHRHLVIDQLAADARPTQVIEIASGLSRRGVSMSAKPSLRYTEIDLPEMVNRKRELLGRTPAGQAALARENLRLLASDVATTPLDRLVEPGAALFVIAEGLFMYLNADEQQQLWTRIRQLFEITPGTFVFDLVPTGEQPRPGLVGRALEALMKVFTRGRSFERDARTRDDIAAALNVAGFSRVELLEPRSVARAWALPFADVRTQQLLFVCRP
jgi:O-methyltransferase involved in polyketide biosynthesis